ncbi:glycosyltransferase [Williamsia sp. CHRR-6]|uniref:glycosyltransferase n=1 Tax=Williamsia sp. CHRR-6 TaxID=2835871 RepID=UPI001BD9FF80|nr:glycosyltransferase [Williamsia sp. CHRR-6]MBT0568150.1 glycosyltransferase [Williamsia sp. CHRR-6]
MRIAEVANFYGPRSGGLRTAVDQLGQGYAAGGHEVALVVPGARAAEETLDSGVTRITVPALEVPGTGGYRVADPFQVIDVLRGLRPDAVEISDRLTLRGIGPWARRHDIASVMISHERLDRLLGQVLPTPWARRAADLANARTAATHDAVVCTTGFATAEFERIGATNVHRVPLGVDLDLFHPQRRCPDRGDAWRAGAAHLLVHCGRLSVEKHVERSIDTCAELVASGVDARLVIAGDGPRRPALTRRAAGLPVEFIGFVDDRTEVAALLASADAVMAPGPHETFCLSALESLAAGTPVVASRTSAVAEVISQDCGAVADNTTTSFADGVRSVLALPGGGRVRARCRAEDFGWPASVDGMLAVLSA